MKHGQRKKLLHFLLIPTCEGGALCRSSTAFVITFSVGVRPTPLVPKIHEYFVNGTACLSVRILIYSFQYLCT